MTSFDSEWSAILVVILAGFLPTEVWRSLAIVAGRRLQEGSEVLQWVRAVATALLAAVVARLIFVPTGMLVEAPLWLRLACVASGLAAFFAVRRSVFAGVLVGEVVLIGGAWMLVP
ncbi:AzlD domain-containing protein [Aquabacter cavernae]|uniref:AzlD domain-containing protein n=1 Tax=Aquabacter cavernae TaxID=2496029 RepID=UPI000F8F36F1|nr:AzlD domain-containing protein [Aquabacter cavernae]